MWQRCVGFEHNQGLGGAELSVDKLNLSQHIGGWYPLFPMHSFGSDSNDSPWPIIYQPIIYIGARQILFY